MCGLSWAIHYFLPNQLNLDLEGVGSFLVDSVLRAGKGVGCL